MRKSAAALSLVLAMCAGTAFASSVTLTFTGLQNLEPVDNYYNGGAGGNGTTGGTNYGISFSSNSLALINGANGGSGNVSNEPAPATDTSLVFLSGSGDIMDDVAGFTTGFSFYYSAPVYPGTVSVYSGLDGTGSLLGTVSLNTTPQGCDSSGTNYDCWVNTGVAFAGTAESVNFSGTANYIVFSDITLGASSVPPPNPGPAPEPSSFVMLGSGLLAGAGMLRRRFAA